MSNTKEYICELEEEGVDVLNIKISDDLDIDYEYYEFFEEF